MNSTVTERWLPIALDTAHPYSVSNMGRVRSEAYVMRDGRSRGAYIVAEDMNNCGYMRVALLMPTGRQKKFFVHRLVAQAFLPEKPGSEYVNHLDGDKTNNCVYNLEWCTSSENQLHNIYVLHPEMVKHGIETSSAKLTDAQAVDIYNSNERVVDLAERYGVTVSCIYQIKQGRRHCVKDRGRNDSLQRRSLARF